MDNEEKLNVFSRILHHFLRMQIANWVVEYGQKWWIQNKGFGYYLYIFYEAYEITWYLVEQSTQNKKEEEVNAVAGLSIILIEVDVPEHFT